MAMSRSFSSCGSISRRRRLDGVDLRLNFRLLFRRGVGQALPKLCFRLFQRAGGIGMHGNGRIAEHRLRPRGGDRHVRRLAGLGVDDRIAEVPEMALDRLVEDLIVADGRLEERVPIDQPLAAIDFALLEQREERLADRPAQTSSSVNRVRCQSQLQPICFNWPMMRAS